MSCYFLKFDQRYLPDFTFSNDSLVKYAIEEYKYKLTANGIFQIYDPEYFGSSDPEYGIVNHASYISKKQEYFDIADNLVALQKFIFKTQTDKKNVIDLIKEIENRAV